eukprot:126724_1
MSQRLERIYALINGYIRNAELLLKDNNIIPPGINKICMKFYDSKWIHMFCKIKPLLQFDIQKGYKSIINIQSLQNDNKTITIHDEKGKRFNFQLDKIYDENTTQHTISQDLQHFINNIFNGGHLSLFMYGQTGAGKSHTMQGSVDNPGIITNSMQYIFKTINSDQYKTFQFEIKVAIFHIYNEQILDQLYTIDDENGCLNINQNTERDRKRHKIRHLRNGKVYVDGLKWIKIKSFDDLLFLQNNAKTNYLRHITYMSAHSSRFHQLMLCDIYCKNVFNNAEYVGKINFIELAGSETVLKYGRYGTILKEAQNINKSLCAFGDVLQSLQRDNKFIPYRNSKLTHLLMNSLDRNNECEVIVYLNICSTDIHSLETIRTLTFGQQQMPGIKYK